MACCPPECRCRVSLTASRRPRSPAARRRRDPHDDLAALGELDRVVHQVDEHLPQAERIAARAAAGDRADRFELELDPFASWRAPASSLTTSSDEPARSNVDRLDLQLAGLDLGEVENVVDDREQCVGRAARPSRRSRAARRSSSVSSEQLGHAEHAVHRRADLVAHVGQELALGAARRPTPLPWPPGAPGSARRSWSRGSGCQISSSCQSRALSSIPAQCISRIDTSFCDASGT